MILSSTGVYYSSLLSRVCKAKRKTPVNNGRCVILTSPLTKWWGFVVLDGSLLCLCSFFYISRDLQLLIASSNKSFYSLIRNRDLSSNNYKHTVISEIMITNILANNMVGHFFFKFC